MPSALFSKTLTRSGKDLERKASVLSSAYVVACFMKEKRSVV